MIDEKYCKNHGLKLEEKKMSDMNGLFFKMMMFFNRPQKFNVWTGRERVFLVCPKKDYAVSI